jgi:hypothetical protein
MKASELGAAALVTAAMLVVMGVSAWMSSPVDKGHGSLSHGAPASSWCDTCTQTARMGGHGPNEFQTQHQAD